MAQPSHGVYVAPEQPLRICGGDAGVAHQFYLRLVLLGDILSCYVYILHHILVSVADFLRIADRAVVENIPAEDKWYSEQVLDYSVSNAVMDKDKCRTE